MKKILLLLLVLSSGCSTTRIAPIGPDTYLVQRKAGTGYTSASGLKMDALEAANEHCSKMNKKLLVVSTETQAVAFASTPSADVQFMCLDANDPELKRPKLESVPNNRIEVKNN